MKILAIFMIILTFFTGFDLCRDDDVYEGKDLVAATESSSSDKHTEEAPCTPFCSCARCPFSVLLPSEVIEFPSLSVQSPKFCTYLSLNPIQISSSIWQPPRLA